MDDLLLTEEEIAEVFKRKTIFASSPEMKREAEASLVVQAQLAKADPQGHYERGYQDGQKHSIGTDNEIRKDERERIFRWGDEDCPHNNTVRLKVKRGCIACWQALKEEE